MGSGFVSKGFSVDLGSIHSDVTTITLSLAAPCCPSLFLYLHLSANFHNFDGVNAKEFYLLLYLKPLRTRLPSSQEMNMLLHFVLYINS